MSEQTQTPDSPGDKARASKKAGVKMAATEASVSTTIDVELKERFRQRAEEEERTEAVLFRRALRAYMKDWVPGQGDD